MNQLCTPSLLVALPQLQDPNFHKAVILLVEHNNEGGMGFIINRPSQIPLCELVSVDEIDIPYHIPAWVGGPVGADNGLVLHNELLADEMGTSLTPDISLSSSDSALKNLVSCIQHHRRGKNHFGALYPYRFLVGYAGWGPRQLDEELKMGAWIQVSLDSRILFDTPWQGIWDAALEGIGVDPMNIAPSVQPYLN